MALIKRKALWMNVLAVLWGFSFIILLIPENSQAENSSQLWASVIFGFPTSDRFYLEIETQPKIQVSGGEEWRNMDVTWLVEYYPSNWLDVTGELATGITEETEDLRSYELTPKVGVRFHLVEQVIKKGLRYHELHLERLPLTRLYLAGLFRLEYRNFYYSGDLDSSHEVRFRFRPELKVAINNPSLGDDKTLSFHTDIEFFFPLSDSVTERFSNKVRFRGGLGYRINYNYRIEMMYVYDFNRDSSLQDFGEDANMLDVRMTFLF